MTDLQHFRKQKNHNTSNTAFERKREAAVLDSLNPKCPFTANTSKNRMTQSLSALTQRAKIALQSIELLKKKEGWAALLRPNVRRRHWPRRSRAGLTPFEATLWLLIAIAVLGGVLALYNGAVDTLRTAALRTQLTRAVAIIERDHTYSGVYAATSLLPFLNNEGFTEKELRKIGTGTAATYEFNSPFDTSIEIEGDGARDFTVTLAGLPPSGCEAAAMAFANRNSGLDKLVIGTQEFSDVQATQITELQVGPACDNDENTVALTF